MKAALTRLLFAALFLASLPSIAADKGAAAQRAEAEQLFAAGSYEKAHEIYRRLDGAALPADEARWVKFRVADTLWRSQAATQTADSTKLDQAQQQLEALVRDARRDEEHDLLWAEVQESLADFWWMRRGAQNWGQAWPYYERALDWWAGAADIEAARQRYLRIAWNTAKPPWVEPRYSYGSHGNYLPQPVLENVLKIARTDDEQAHAHYLIAMALRHRGGDLEQIRRVPAEFAAALAPGRQTDWYDDALFHGAEWLLGNGAVVRDQQGGWRQEPDFVGALGLYRRLVAEFSKGETRYFDLAGQRIGEITRPTVGLYVSNVFAPGAEIQFGLTWRNVGRVDFALYRVDLPRDVSLAGKDASAGGWVQQIDLSVAERIKSWSKTTGDKDDHKPGSDTVRLEGGLPAGAYVLQATGAGQTARELLLVTGAALVLKSSPKRGLVYFCDALDGSPLAGARTRLWERYYEFGKWHWRDQEKTTDQDGLAVFDLGRDNQNTRELFVSASLQGAQAFSLGQSHTARRDNQRWRIYAFTDRPAYRPNEQVRWKLTARLHDGSLYTTPAGRVVEYEIADPRGAKVHEGKAALNDFGSAWGTLELTGKMPLGEYRVRFWEEGRSRQIGDATLFRLEEYKLPEFKVTIRTPEEKGRKRSFRLGESVEVAVQADYYFGGPVANATVEVLVRQLPFQHGWYPPSDYPWFYEDLRPSRHGASGDGPIVKRETLKTDAAGAARLTFETPGAGGQDFEYRVEARVTDASRREVSGGDSVRVTRQRYYVHPRPAHNLYRPQDKVAVGIKALDANDRPVAAAGTVTITRDTWYEIWFAPDGREVRGGELEKLRGAAAFPPAIRAGEPAWRLKFRGYEREEISRRTVKTDAGGEAEVTFTPARDGYYRVAWSSEDQDAPPVTAECAVWVATNATTELGYRQGGVEIIVDSETFRVGQTAPVMLVAPASDRYVLFTVEGEELDSWQLVHLTGTAKLVELAIGERHVPNVFLGAALVADRQIFNASSSIVVPPTKNFLTVEVAPDRPLYQPREEGTLTVTARDHNGEPVAAEVALALVDESVFSIQDDYAGDPRRFFYGTKRPRVVQTQSTFQQKPYARPTRDGQEHGLEEQGAGRGGQDYYATSGLNGSRLRSAGTMAAAEASGSAPMPAAAAPATFGDSRNEMKKMKEDRDGGGEGPAVVVRSDFRSTVLWRPDVVTGRDGTATVKVTFPDSLTTWRATARAAGAGNQFGIAEAATRTRQPLIVRLQAPRFFVAGDAVVVSAVINNNTDVPLRVQPGLEAEGLEITGLFERGRAVKGDAGPRDVPANGEARVDWYLRVLKPGQARLKVSARGAAHADAMEKTYPVFEHGIEKLVAASGRVRGNDVTVRLDIPKQRKPGSTTLTVQVAPSLAATMLDALPYLIDYPYGCTEQTMSRFLPAAITAKTLRDLGLDPDAAMGKVFGGVERAFAQQTHPEGQKPLARVGEMAAAGLDRLYDFQHGDGGWGWWKQGESDRFMSAYVVWGLTLARQAGETVRAEVLQRGAAYLDKELVEEEASPDGQAWLLHALSAYHALEKRREVGGFQAKALGNLWVNRDRLNAYSRALLALAAHNYGYAERARTLVANLENGVKRDDRPDSSVLVGAAPGAGETVMGTAHWGEDGLAWRWSDGGIEATAFALRALLAIDPGNPLVEPVATWLVRNRRGAQWKNTRDTAIVVLALNDYLRATRELSPEFSYELLVNGTRVVSKKLTGADTIAAPSRFEIDPALVRDGVNDVRIRRTAGAGALYFSAEARFFSLEEPIPPAGNEIFVRRQYFKLAGRPTLLKGFVYERQPLDDGDTVASGDRVETVVTVDARNNYEYLVFEDLKPAGLEAVAVRSGAEVYARELKAAAVRAAAPGSRSEADFTNRKRWVYQELRDRTVAMFLDRLPEGVWEIRYDLRAEAPGTFHALPVLGHAMYVPEIRCNGAETRITVEDAPERAAEDGR